MRRRQRRTQSLIESESEEEDQQFDFEEGTPSKRGRKAQDPQWTRVVKFMHIMNDDVEIFSIMKDLYDLKNQSDDETQIQQTDIIPIIYHSSLDQEDQDLELENFRLSNDILIQYGITSTQLRSDLETKAQLLDNQDKDLFSNDEGKGGIPPKKLYRKLSRRPRGIKREKPQFNAEVSDDILGRRKRKLCDLSFEEKLEIIHKALIQHFKYKDIAILHKIKLATIKTLVDKSLKSKDFIEELKMVNIKKEQDYQIIEDAAKELLKTQDTIFNTQQVLVMISKKSNTSIKTRQVAFVLKNRLDLTFRKLKRISNQANSNKNLILRQKFGLKILDLQKSGKIVINVDESWIDEKDYSRRSWRKRGVSNSIGVKAITPRISFMVAIDTNGEVFYSLTQVNTDSDVKWLLLTELCKMLDLDRPDWRETSVIIMDNAPYNKSQEIIAHIESLRIPMVFTASYSYDASPVELFFAYFKKGLIVEPDIPTGKLSFQNVVAGVNNRIQQMRRSAYIRFWKHAILSQFKYLSFETI